ncbi:MAG: PaaX family transcriptional regulator C-terminal domain-containing protein [Sediminimonas sp.]|uniref:Phenylacetic acid degradation protein n=1 Tax=Sediminimonas qiaohouensis TaxID=552061 RepID=A0A7C9HCF8_9RHOB|nr:MULTISPECIES: PaaX family transcriptional regulator C-terminal domain-containing protein [Sediminimonas]MDR9485184.1 PaaX family transcriptional regulator C-terminal domain-containing protein [Sediminimonas sp.]MTJ06024.1 phenylacetic acid degradation protein [Sediminimonas qiaohouensis]
MDPLAPLIDALHSEGRLRVWSLVITVFGDSVQHRGGRISTARLGRLLGRVGVEQGALRTALSRLARDGWVTSERIGRSSVYRLSQSGLSRFTEATGRIYAAPRAAPVGEWVLALGPEQPGLPLGGGWMLRPADKNTDNIPTPYCAVTGALSELSDDMREAILGEGQRAALEALARDLDILEGLSLDPFDAAAARTLLIHRWRRIVLRYPEPPNEVLPHDLCSPAPPRARVARAYLALSPAAERWFDQCGEDVLAMPCSPTSLDWRFRTS